MTSSPLSRRFFAVLLAAALGLGAALWAAEASGSDPLGVLTVSKPQPVDEHPAGSNHVEIPATKRPGTSVVKPTPAQIGRPAVSQVDSERPLTVTLASETTMRVRKSATAASGALSIPSDIKQAGWWDGSSRLGDPFGAIVVAAHVDSFTQGLGRFAELLSMKPGDVIRLSSARLRESFQVASAELVPKTSISATSRLFSAGGQSRLVLITCGGEYDPARGGYQSNMVVVAIAKSPVRALG